MPMWIRYHQWGNLGKKHSEQVGVEIWDDIEGDRWEEEEVMRG